MRQRPQRKQAPRMNWTEKLEQIEAKLRGAFRQVDSELHGLAHLREVAILAGRIAAELDQDVEAAMVAGFLHDCGRVDDSVGSDHARDSARLARALLKERFPHLDAERICEAIRHHADGLLTGDPLAGAVWDADRLTLGRAGIALREELLSTRPGRRLARRRRVSGASAER
jgi:uncharacterized protein